VGDLPIFAVRWWSHSNESGNTFAIIDRCAITPKFRGSGLSREIIDRVIKDIEAVAYHNQVVIQYLLILLPRLTWIEEKIVASGFTLASTSDSACQEWDGMDRGMVPHVYYMKYISH
jgi:hypothetical protein